MGVLSERVDVRGRWLAAGILEIVVVMVGGGVGVNAASTVVAVDISMADWMDEERADMIDRDLGGMVDRITGMQVIVGVPTGLEVAVMVMGIKKVTTIAELERVEVEVMISKVGTNVVVFVVIAEILLLLERGMVLIGASESIEDIGSVVNGDTVSAIVAVVVGFAAARAVMDAGSFTPAIAQS